MWASTRLETRVVVVGFYDLGSDEAVEWNPLMPSVIVVIIPVGILSLFCRADQQTLT